jgi:hypothetical protein
MVSESPGFCSSVSESNAKAGAFAYAVNITDYQGSRRQERIVCQRKYGAG